LWNGLRGVIHGKTIELLSDPGLSEGQAVEITIRPLGELKEQIAAIRATVGSLAYLPPEPWDELDAIIAERRVFSSQGLA